MKATITNAAGETTVYKLDKFPFPKKGVQPDGYQLVDQDDNPIMSRVTRSPWGAYTYVMYKGVSYSFPRHVELSNRTKVEFSEGTVTKTPPTNTVSPMDVKTLNNLVEDIIQDRKVQEAAEAAEEYYQAQLETPKDPLDAASEWVREQEVKRGLGQAQTVSEYLPPFKPPRKAPKTRVKGIGDLG